MQKSRKDQVGKLNETLWACYTAQRNPIGMSPYKMVYGKACYLPLELENKSYLVVKISICLLRKQQKILLDIHALGELRNSAYDSAHLFKRKLKMWHNCKILKQMFVAGDKVLLFNFCLKLFLGKVRSRSEGPYEIEEV